MKIHQVSQERKISGVPIVGRNKLFEAIDLYASNPPPCSYPYTPPARSSRIVRSAPNELAAIGRKEIFLERLKELIKQELDKSSSTSQYFSEAVEPFNRMYLRVTVLDKEKEAYVLNLTRDSDESFEEQLAQMHHVERALKAITIDINFVKDGDEIKIDFEELLRSLDPIEELNTNGLQGSEVLDEITESGRKENKFLLGTYRFKSETNRQTQMNFYSITQGYPLSRNQDVCMISGPVLIAPLEENDSPKIEFKITGKGAASQFSDEPIVDKVRKIQAISLGDKIFSVFSRMVPQVEKPKPRQNRFLRMFSGLLLPRKELSKV